MTWPLEDAWPDPRRTDPDSAPHHLLATSLSTTPLPTAPSRPSRRRGSPEPVALQHAPYPGEWRLDAACRGLDTNLFFPRRGEDQSVVMAVCDSCPVQEECRDYAMSVGALLQGVYGRANERQRRMARAGKQGRRRGPRPRPERCACGADVRVAGQCWGCYLRRRRRARGVSPRVLDAEERFWSKVDTDGPAAPGLPSELGPCWIWTGGRGDRGFGAFGYGNGKVGTAYRWAYEHFVGPVSDGHELDQLCDRRLCVNPAHLEAVTHQERSLRGRRNQYVTRTHCKNGHPFDQVKTNPRTGRPMRVCSICKRERKREARRRARERKRQERRAG